MRTHGGRVSVFRRCFDLLIGFVGHIEREIDSRLWLLMETSEYDSRVIGNVVSLRGHFASSTNLSGCLL